MSEQAFTYDVLPIHSAKDKPVVRPLAERLRADGLKVWFDEWEAPSPAGAGEGGRRPGEGRVAHADGIPAKIEDGLEHSRVLPLAHRMGEDARRAGEGCMSANAFTSDCAQLACPAVASEPRRKGGTFRFRDPLNTDPGSVWS